MADKFSGCVLCGVPLLYAEVQTQKVCAVCGGSFMAGSECVKGHYVCDSCHSRDVFSLMRVACLSMESCGPVEVLEVLMSLPGVRMHGPEHHVLVGASLLTSYRNFGGDLDLPSALDEMIVRGSKVPGGICGMWGTCGAAVSCGIAYSIITGSTPLSEGVWGRCNVLTSECLREIGELGGPRCCKRDAYTALKVALRFISDDLGVDMMCPSRIHCTRSGSNSQCIGDRCPYRV